MSEFWGQMAEDLSRRIARWEAAERELQECRRHVGSLQELLKEAGETKAILRDERDTARLDLTAMRGNQAANVALMDKYFHENTVLQRERSEALNEAEAMRQERDEWKARWEKEVGQTIARVEADRMRRAEIFAAQNREERDRARQERAEALKLICRIEVDIDRFRTKE